MPFITPLILLGALAGLIPVAIHFFFRSRYRTVPWAAMKFLLTSVEQTSRRLKFQEYLLLLTRVALLAFLAVALARPINLSTPGFFYLLAVVAFTVFALTWVLSPLWQMTSSKFANMLLWSGSQTVLLVLAALAWLPLFFGGMTGAATAARGEGDAVDVVFVFDTSYSMGAIDRDGKTRMALARAEALKVIDELPPHSTVQIVTCAGKGKTLLGPRSPADLETAKRLIDELDIVHLATDLHPGVYEAKDVLARGQATNKELYVFSDMQKMGWEQQSGELKAALTEIKEKAHVHLVRCGTRVPKNVAIIDIAPQAGVPRPGVRVGFAVQIRNAGPDPVEKLTVSLAVNGGKEPETARIVKISPGETHAVTLTGKLDKPGLHLLTAKVATDDLEADNRFDQVIQVREQVNILVVDGNFNKYDRDAERSSSYYLMHSIIPVLEADRATYKYNPRMITAAAATPESLQKQDICILVNCAVPGKLGQRGDVLRSDFLDALDPFVRKGHGLIVFSGDNVVPDAYNKQFGKKLGFLPLPLKGTAKATGLEPFTINRKTFGQGPLAYQNFKDDDYFRAFDFVEVWQHVEMDETPPKLPVKAKKDEDPVEPVEPVEPNKEKLEKEKPRANQDDLVNVIVRLNNGKPLIASRKVDTGEVVFVGTAAHYEGFDAKTLNPNWTNFNALPTLVMFLDVTIGHLLRGQTQTYNLVAGRTLNWYPTEKVDYVYSLVHPDGKATRLGLPEKEKGDKRYVVTTNDLPRAGIYRMVVMPRGMEGADSIDPAEALKHGTPIAVTADLTESADLTSLSDAEIDGRLGFTPIHITAGEEQGGSAGTERDKREWTVWALCAVLALVLFEVAFAWYCGKAW